MTTKRKPRKRKVSSKKKKSQMKISSRTFLAIGLICLIVINILIAYYEKGNELATSSEIVQSESANQTTISFIESIGESARQIAHQNDLYASVMIAQAILESSNGQSTLSQAPNYNFFGIKGDYNGNSVTLQTWEDDGSGNTYLIDADFRAYNSQEQSLQDYANLLQKSIYAGVHKSNTRTYMDATAALTGTYATDTYYGAKLNSLIESYGLTLYDL